MFDKRLKEAIDLLGGKAVIKDRDQYYIILSFNEFRKMSKVGVDGLTKQELVDKINNDIASWKVSQEEQKACNIDLEEIGELKNEEIRYERSI